MPIPPPAGIEPSPPATPQEPPRDPPPCPVCGAQECGHARTVAGWRICYCAGCGLGITWPRPTPRELDALYDKAYLAKYVDDCGTNEKGWRRDYGRRVAALQRWQPSGRLLDVGCGPGYLMAAARERGFDVQGFDVSESAVSFAREQLKLPVTVGSWSTTSFEDGAFDCVTMMHVLEHCADPRDCLGKVRQWLRSGGTLFVEVPNAASDDARWYGEAWAGWSLPHHLWHFTPTTLETLIGRSGFEVGAVAVSRSDYIVAQWSKRPVLKWLRRWFAKRHTGTNLTVVVCKP